MDEKIDSATLEEILGEPTSELDDDEFGIPVYKDDTTLESIMHEDEEELVELDTKLLSVKPENLDVVSMSSCDSSPSVHSNAQASQLSTSAPSVSSVSSPKVTRRLEALRKPVTAQRKNSNSSSRSYRAGTLVGRDGLSNSISNTVIKRGVLDSVSTQLRSMKARAGTPTCVSFTYYIAVGTSHGLTIVYDAKQVMKWCLGALDRASEHGAVSCLTFNMDSTRLLVGHARGLVTMWDLTSGKLLRRISDAHPPGNAVLYLRFTDDPTLALLVNSGGSVFQLEFKRSIKGRSCDSSCLFSGSRGEICCLEPLHLMPNVVEHPIYQYRLIAMASFTKVFVLSLRGNMAVKFTHPLRGEAATLPLLAWQWVTTEHSKFSGRVMEPVLAFARDHSVHLLQVSHRGQAIGSSGLPTPILASELIFRPIQTISVDYTLLSIHWMTPNTMALIDTKEKLHLIDIPSEEVLEVSDLSPIGLCYNSSLYKSLATGGNVSELLAYAGESACYHSMCVGDGQLVILGVKRIHCLTIRDWRDRLATLVKRHRPDLAVQLCVALMTDSAKGVKGLPREKDKRRNEVRLEAKTLLSTAVQEAREIWRSPDAAGESAVDLSELWRALAGSCIELHMLLHPSASAPFEGLYANFCAGGPQAAAPFLDSLLPLIAAGRLTSLPPALIQDLVEHCRSRGRLRAMEAAIVRLDAANLDLDQVVRLCKRHDLFDALIHLYGAALRDYRGPMEDMCQLLHERMQGLRPDDEAWPSDLGNKLLVYISSCLGGRSYVTGSPMEEEEAERVQALTFKFLLEEKPGEGATETGRFPHLSTLLLSNTKDFLNVLALAFDEEFMLGEAGRPRRQKMIDSLVVCMTKQKMFSLSQVGSLFVFIARQLVRPENAQLRFDKSTFDQVLEWLCQVEDRENIGLNELAEQQQVIIDLLTANEAFGKSCYSEDRLLVMAQKAQFYQVMEFLHRKNGRYVDVVTCYLDDPYRKDQVFTYLKTSLADADVPSKQKIEIKAICMERIKDLADISAEKTVSLLVKTLHERIDSMVGRLKKQPYTLFLLLRGYFAFYSSRDSSPVHSNDSNSQEQRAVANEGPRSIDPVVSECYIELMVEYDTSELESFLRMNTDYRTQAAIKLVKQCDEPHAMAYLYEKAGHPALALEIYIMLFNGDWANMLATRDESGQASIPSISSVEKSFKECVDFCQKNSVVLEAQIEREKLWFPVLDCILEKQRELDNSEMNKSTIKFIKSLAQAVISAMSPHILVPAILQRILQDPLYAHEKMADLKDMILGMLVTFNYESTLLETCCRLVGHDVVRAYGQYVENGRRGFGPRKYRCELCRWPLCGVSVSPGGANSDARAKEQGEGDGLEEEEEADRSEGQMTHFRCGHGYHTSCLLSVRAYIGFRNSPEWFCFVCMQQQQQGDRARKGGRATPQLRSEAVSATFAPPSMGISRQGLTTLTPISWDRLQSFQESTRRVNSAEILKELARETRERERTASSTTGGLGSSSKNAKLVVDACLKGLKLRAPSIYDD